MCRPLKTSPGANSRGLRSRKDVPLPGSRSVLSAFTALGFALVLTACGGEIPSEQDQTNQSTETAAASVSARESTASPQDRESNRGDCDLITDAELDAAFGGKLSFRKLQGFGQRGRGCTAVIVGVEGEFILQAQTRESFETRRDTYQTYVDQSSATMTPVDVGVEGYLVNNAQIIAIDDQGRSISVALQIFVFGGELPLTPQDTSTSLEVIARQALARF